MIGRSPECCLPAASPGSRATPRFDRRPAPSIEIVNVAIGCERSEIGDCHGERCGSSRGTSRDVPIRVLPAHAPQGCRHALIVVSLDVHTVEHDPGALGHVGRKAVGMLKSEYRKRQSMPAAPGFGARVIQREQRFEPPAAILALCFVHRTAFRTSRHPMHQAESGWLLFRLRSSSPTPESNARRRRWVPWRCTAGSSSIHARPAMSR